MKPTTTETAQRHGGQPLQQLCGVCGKPYRGTNTVALPVGNGRYRDFPAHRKCEERYESGEYR